MTFRNFAMMTMLGASIVPGCYADALFTINPASATPSLNGAAFSATSAQLANYSQVTYTGFVSGSATSFTDQGFLNVTGFLNGVTAVSPELNQSSGYGMYLAFSATGTQSLIPDGGGNLGGTFSSLNVTLYGYNLNGGTGAQFTVDGGGAHVTNNAGAFALATGSLVSGTDQINSLGNPSDALLVTLLAAAGESGAFVTLPSTSLGIVLTGASASTTAFGPPSTPLGLPGTGVNVVNGSGTAAFPTPEPGSIGLIAGGLLGLAAFRRKAK